MDPHPPMIGRQNAPAQGDDLLALCGEPLGRVSPEGRLEPLNPAWERVLGRSRDELRGLALLSSIHPEDRAALSLAWKEARLGGRDLPRAEARMRRGGGDWARLSWTFAPAAQPGTVLVALRDLTQEHALRETLLALQPLSQLGRIAMGLVHDVNNLLSILSGSAAQLRGALGPDSPHNRDVECLDEVVNVGRSLAQSVADTIHGASAVGSADLNAAAESAHRLLSRPLGAVRMRLELAPDAGRVALSSAQLAQILLNLCLNARDAMPDGGGIIVATSRACDGRGGAVLSVSDTGPGMPAEVQKRAFELRFTTKAPGRGTGLGLAAVRALAESCGGSVNIVSRMGRGTAVYVHLPDAPPR